MGIFLSNTFGFLVEVEGRAEQVKAKHSPIQVKAKHSPIFIKRMLRFFHFRGMQQ